MNPQLTRRSRVSRETRLLLITALLSVVALWILARFRFPDRPAGTPVQLLTQLAGRGALDELAFEIGQIRLRLEPLLASSGLRIRDDAAVTLLDGTSPPAHEVLNVDSASRLAVVRAPFLPAPPPVPWTPRDPREPRYVLVTDVTTGSLGLRPVFLGSLVPTASPLWPRSIWLTPDGTDLKAGALVFTTDALLVGLVVDHEGQAAILPGAVLLAEADRLLNQPPRAAGEFGAEVQALTAPVAKATGAASGVVVTRVDPAGPSAGALEVGDVLETGDGMALESPLHWKAHASRVSAGQSTTVRVRRGGESRDVVLVAAEPSPSPAPTLGLGLRNVPQAGSEVTQVDAASLADRAGLRPGDVITLIGTTRAPSPAAVRRAIEQAPPGHALLVAFVRDGTQAVTALEK